MRTLITGGGGFLGRYLTEELLSRGWPVRILGRGNHADLERLGVETINGDIRDAAVVADACRDVETVFHVAAVAGIWGSRRLYESTNVGGTKNVIDAAVRAGAQRLIITSSPSVIFDDREHHDFDESLPYPTHYLCHYARTKAIAEQLVLQANGRNGLATCSIRPHLMWGPRDNHLVPRLLRRAASGRLRQVGDGTNQISQIYVTDAARAHAEAAAHLSVDSPLAGQAYFVDSGESVNLWEWIAEILRRAGLPPVKRSISYRRAYFAGRLFEGLYWLLGRTSEPVMTRFLANQLSLTRTYRITKAMRDFGFRPQVSFDEGMRRLAADLPRMLAEDPAIARSADRSRSHAQTSQS